MACQKRPIVFTYILLWGQEFIPNFPNHQNSTHVSVFYTVLSLFIKKLSQLNNKYGSTIDHEMVDETAQALCRCKVRTYQAAALLCTR